MRKTQRMQEYDDSKFLGCCKKRSKCLIDSSRPSTCEHISIPRISYSLTHRFISVIAISLFCNGTVPMPTKRSGKSRHRLGDAIVHDLRGFSSDFGRRKVKILSRCRTYRLNVDTECIHIGNPAIDPVEFGLDLLEELVVHSIGRRAGKRKRFGGVRHEFPDQSIRRTNIQVRVNVDDQSFAGLLNEYRRMSMCRLLRGWTILSFLEAPFFFALWAQSAAKQPLWHWCARTHESTSFAINQIVCLYRKQAV